MLLWLYKKMLCRMQMSDSPSSGTGQRPVDAENYDWIVMKSLIDTHEQLMCVMEKHALSAVSTGESPTEELVARLESARRNHERAIDDIDMAIAGLREQAAADESAGDSDSTVASDP